MPTAISIPARKIRTPRQDSASGRGSLPGLLYF
ncbi:hypothetical protein RB2501_11407 [Robiginitalea biformata HTCC2501]|uniref:Uncharacterized protein n=1 Tax=Robiginitalea biformata (strain ATCC BAA-864 / DSM 15991 / KCTC 12146 / HTCC2501) TaxID=313596 RepID=A4CMN8_ROBBH|nr:hypothetical protein RB2501_11407 [Robiginitalea biformata HTCC2501]